MIDLSVLENRLYHSIPEEYHENIARELDRFEMETSRMSKEENKIGQATLTPFEIKKLNTRNQYEKEGFTVIQWQALKAIAIENGIEDWMSHVDSSLSYHENKLNLDRKNDLSFR